MNHLLVAALMFGMGVVFTFGTATAVQYWATSRQAPADPGPVVDMSLLSPHYEAKRRSSDCEPSMWPQPALTRSRR